MGIEPAAEPVGIVLADDHPLVRGGLRRVLELNGALTVVGQAGDVEGALALVRAHRPRVVVLDRALAKDPADRQQSAGELATEVSAALAGY